jgi:hypothetical protein
MLFSFRSFWLPKEGWPQSFSRGDFGVAFLLLLLHLAHDADRSQGVPQMNLEQDARSSKRQNEK